jgi:hypothetical protein
MTTETLSIPRLMTNLTAQEIYDIAASILKEKELPEPRSIWSIQDTFSKQFTDKGTYQNRTQITVFIKLEGKELFSFTIEVLDEAEYRKKLYHLLLTEVKFNS